MKDTRRQDIYSGTILKSTSVRDLMTKTQNKHVVSWVFVMCSVSTQQEANHISSRLQGKNLVTKRMALVSDQSEGKI